MFETFQNYALNMLSVTQDWSHKDHS
jgi:hypothetical protein